VVLVVMDKGAVSVADAAADVGAADADKGP
jgi:hypothetical protein